MLRIGDIQGFALMISTPYGVIKMHFSKIPISYPNTHIDNHREACYNNLKKSGKADKHEDPPKSKNNIIRPDVRHQSLLWPMPLVIGNQRKYSARNSVFSILPFKPVAFTGSGNAYLLAAVSTNNSDSQKTALQPRSSSLLRLLVFDKLPFVRELVLIQGATSV